MVSSDEKHPPYAPASVHDSKQFYEFAKKYTIYWSFYSVLFSYIASIILINNQELYAWTISIVPSFAVHRFETLSSIGGSSPMAYVATLLFCTAAFPVVAAFVFYKYYKFVLRSGNFREIEAKGIAGTFFGLIFILIFYYIVFYMDFKYDKGIRPGIVQLLMWPIFPLFGGLSGAFIAPFMFFNVPVGLYKIWSKFYR